MSYAKNTSVSVSQSMAQVRQILMKNKVDGVAIAEAGNQASTQFTFEGKPYKFDIFYPDERDPLVTHTTAGKKRTPSQIEAEIEKEKRRLWRAMVLYVKASIEAHNNGLVDLKRSMMAHMMLPSGGTVYQKIEGSLGAIEANPQLLLN